MFGGCTAFVLEEGTGHILFLLWLCFIVCLLNRLPEWDNDSIDTGGNSRNMVSDVVV